MCSRVLSIDLFGVTNSPSLSPCRRHLMMKTAANLYLLSSSHLSHNVSIFPPPPSHKEAHFMTGAGRVTGKTFPVWQILMRDGSGVELTVAENNREIAIGGYFKHPCAQTESVLKSLKGIWAILFIAIRNLKQETIRRERGCPRKTYSVSLLGLLAKIKV